MDRDWLALHYGRCRTGWISHGGNALPSCGRSSRFCCTRPQASRSHAAVPTLDISSSPSDIPRVNSSCEGKTCHMDYGVAFWIALRKRGAGTVRCLHLGACIRRKRMKKTLTLGTLMLGCCLAAVAQTGSTPNQNPPMTTPSTFPQDQTGQSPSNPVNPADPSALPPDTRAPGSMSHDHTGERPVSAPPTSLVGCLSQSSEGNFILADSSGKNFRLRGDASQLNSLIGKQVRVDGIATNSDSHAAGSMSSNSASDPSSESAFSVSNVHKLADACSGSSSNQ